MKKDKKKKLEKGKKKGEKVCEVFEVEKEGKKETKRVCELVDSEEKSVSKTQIKRQNKILKNLLILLGGIIFLIVFGVIFFNSLRHFEYNGVEFDVVKYCDAGPCLVLYQTALPVMYNGGKAVYNIYLRNDPRDLLRDVNFEGEVVFLKDMVVNMSSDFNCDGDGVIAVANVVKLYELLDVSVISDNNAGCDSQGRYTFIQIEEGDETKVVRTGPACYTLSVNNCEILEVTERFMLDSLVEINKVVK